MNTLEALLAVMLLIGLVAVVMQAHNELGERLGDPSLRAMMEQTQAARMQKVLVSLGEGRDGNYSSYARWYVG